MSNQKLPTKEEMLAQSDNFMVIEFGYNSKFVVKYETGVHIVSLLKNAEHYDTSVYDNPTITPLNRARKVEVSILSQEDYLNMKMCNLMGMTLSELEAAAGTPDDE